jgi:hypothetical protein
MLRLIVIAVACTFFLIPVAAFSGSLITNEPLLIAVSFGLACIVLPAFLLRIWPAPKGKQSKPMQDALWDGELVTLAYEARSMAQIEEMEDEGLHFLVATDTGETLFLSGQYLYGPVERGVFPSEQVRIFKNKKTDLFYGLEPVGPPLASWPVYAPFVAESTRSDFMLENGKLYARSIPEIVAAIGLREATPGDRVGSSSPQALTRRA